MSRKSYFSKPTYRFLPGGGERENPPIPDVTAFEFDESDFWNSEPRPDQFKKTIPTTRSSKKSTKKAADNGSERAVAAESLPVNIPDWSKMGGRRRGVEKDYSDDENGEGGDRIPPHEYLAKTRIPSFSVHEGVGRTLKGRDLSSVRNAVWEKIGFQD